MEIYINNEVENNENNGIFEEHFKGFVKTAQVENVVIIVREVNPITKFLLPQKFPTKPSEIKNKSSDWGIQAGFVISLKELTFLNKTGLKNNETQADIITNICNKFLIKLDKHNQNCNKINPLIFNMKESETVLTINEKHLNFLCENKNKFGIVKIHFFLDKNIFIHCSQPKNKENSVILYLEKEKNNTYKVYYIFALDNEDKAKNLNGKTLEEIINTEKDNLIYFPITVFCKKIGQEKKPFIPDYDLFAVCWLIDYSIKHHQPRIPTNSFARMKIQNDITVDQEKDFKNIFKKPHSVAEGFEFDQDPEAGNALTATKDFLDRLNKNLGYEEGLSDELCPVHHAFELVNPYSKGFNENFYTVFLPNPELVTDFNFPQEMRVKNKNNIFYFAIDNELGYEKDLWKGFLEPFLRHIQEKGYYVPNNCFVEESNLLGFANSSNHWVKKIRNEKEKKRQLIKTDSGYKSACSVENINNIPIKEQVLTKHPTELNTENNVEKILRVGL